MKYLILILLLLIAACGKAEEKPEPKPWDEEAREIYDAAVQRALSGKFTDGFYVVSRKPNGEPEHLGEAIIWSSVLMASIPCDRAEKMVQDLTDVLHKRNGQLVRYEKAGWVPDEYKNRGINFDGESGFYYGFANLQKRCPGIDLQTPWEVRRRYLEVNDGELWPETGEKMPREFTYVRDLISHKISGDPQPSGSRKTALEAQIVAWVTAVKTAKRPCYPVNLSHFYVESLEWLGNGPSQNFRNAYCGVTNGMDIPTVDHWCGRGDLANWIRNFNFNQWEYRHQRCGTWETPDGKDNESPAVDLIRAISQERSWNG